VIHTFASMIAPALLEQSGRVFYSGRSAFSNESDLYLLGFNPGGDPESDAETTVGHHTNFVLHKAPPLWSAYSDESWKGRPAGTHGLQPRVLHLFRQLGRDPRRTPSSNLIFVRSRRAASLSDDSLEDVCWPLHAEIISRLRPRAIVCLGAKTGDKVWRRLGASSVLGSFEERNERKWKSTAYQTPSGLIVLSLTHPSIADWTAPATDPSPFVLSVLGG
jgi:hypothetical protein